MRFNSFDQVVSWYENTPVLVSKNHRREFDVRPISSRARKWERIKKIDDNTYALLDGNYGNFIWGAVSAGQEEYENTMSPMTWIRRDDGDYIRIRNHRRDSSSVTRYNFLAYHLPYGISFSYNQQGQHWVIATNENGLSEKHALPKCDVKFDWGNKWLVHDDEVFILFKDMGNGKFKRVNEKLKVEVKRVDKELKKQWRDRIDNFYAYCAAMAPLLDTSWPSRAEYRDQIVEWRKNAAANTIEIGWQRTTQSLPVELVREVLSDDEHPLRVAVAVFVISDINGKQQVTTQEELRTIRAAYNRVMNKALGFYKIETK